MNRLQAWKAREFADILIDFAKAIKSEDYTDTRLYDLMNPIFNGFTQALLTNNKEGMDEAIYQGEVLIDELDGDNE